eukprot:jgi/Bigna1/88373/estExt_fgenesh1_pg.C_310089
MLGQGREEGRGIGGSKSPSEANIGGEDRSSVAEKGPGNNGGATKPPEDPETTLFDVRRRLYAEVEKLKKKKAERRKGKNKNNDITINLVAKRSLPKELVARGDHEEISDAAFKLQHVFLSGTGITRIDNLECFNKALPYTYRNLLSEDTVMIVLYLLVITHLHLEDNKITKIQGLEYAPLLELLDLSRNRIEKVDNLSHLKKLKVLLLCGNRIAELQPESLPESLEELDLRDNKIVNDDSAMLRVKKGLPSLWKLDGSAISDSKDDDDDDDDEDVVDEATWGPLFQANQSKLKKYLREKAATERQQDDNSSSKTEDNKGATSTSLYSGQFDPDELRRMWGGDDEDEFRASLSAAFTQIQGERRSSDQIVQRLKESRFKYDLESKRIMVEATREILLRKQKNNQNAQQQNETQAQQDAVPSKAATE